MPYLATKMSCLDTKIPHLATKMLCLATKKPCIARKKHYPEQTSLQGV